MCWEVQRQKISWEIDTSIEQEKKDTRKYEKTMGVVSILGKKKWFQRREEGGRKIFMRGDGIVWVLPQQIPELITRRKEKRRKELIKRWEAPPPGPPKGTPAEV